MEKESRKRTTTIDVKSLFTNRDRFLSRLVWHIALERPSRPGATRSTKGDKRA